MEGRGIQFGSLILALGLVSWLAWGCVSSPTTQPTSQWTETLVPEGGWLIAQDSQVQIYGPSGQVGEIEFSETSSIQGMLIHPATREPIVFVKDQETWVIWHVGQAKRTAVYSSKIAFSNCNLSISGHAVVCVQEGDINLIRFIDQQVSRLDTGAQAAVWSPTNSDLLVVYDDHIDLLGLDVEATLATRLELVHTPVYSAEFLNADQVVWWTGTPDSWELHIFSLRTLVDRTLLAGVLGIDVPGGYVDPSGETYAFPSLAGSNIFSFPQASIQQTEAGVTPVGWTATNPVVQSLDPGTQTTYHFATLEVDGETTSLGSGHLLTTPYLRTIKFTP